MVATVGAAPDVEAILGSLDPEQRAAATLPDGPAQIIAPAGSGKTTTMVARIGVLLSRGVPAGRICVVTFNRDAARDLAARVERRLGLRVGAGGIEIRTLHALARQVLVSVGEAREIVADRLPLLRAAIRQADGRNAGADAPAPQPAQLDTWISVWKVEGRPPPDEVAPLVAAYAAMLRERGALDFDDLVVGAANRLETDPRTRLAWQSRFSHVCVDEFQDVDAAQLRLVRLLAAPEDNLFVVGDDDQTIYAWRLADVRRILRFDVDYPDARRVMLATNYRCPAAVIEASARMVAMNQERFAKPIRPPPGAPDTPDAIVGVDSADPEWTDAAAAMAATEATGGRSICFLSRTRGELTPILTTLVRRGVKHRAALPLPAEAEVVVSLVDAIRPSTGSDEHPFALLLAARRERGMARGDPAADAVTDDEHAALDALLGWATRYARTAEFVEAFDAARERLASLRDPDSLVELATVHAAKGREWETVVLIGFEADRMPNRRSLVDSTGPGRAMEEERRLAYVALTRATRRLLLAFDPRRSSLFLAEMGFGAVPARSRPRHLSQEP